MIFHPSYCFLLSIHKESPFLLYETFLVAYIILLVVLQVHKWNFLFLFKKTPFGLEIIEITIFSKHITPFSKIHFWYFIFCIAYFMTNENNPRKIYGVFSFVSFCVGFWFFLLKHLINSSCNRSLSSPILISTIRIRSFSEYFVSCALHSIPSFINSHSP